MSIASVCAAGQARQVGHLLRLADVGTAVLTGEAAVSDAGEHWHRKHAVAAIAFLIGGTHSPARLIQHLQQVGTAAADLVWSVTLETTFEIPPSIALVAQSRHSMPVFNRSAPVERAMVRADFKGPGPS